MAITLYHNPRCSKSRQAKELLENKGLDFTVREYLKEPLSADEIKTLQKKLNRPFHDMLRPKESEYKEQSLTKTSTDEEILNAIAAAPKLLERPIVEVSDAARIGRPTEDILEIL